MANTGDFIIDSSLEGKDKILSTTSEGTSNIFLHDAALFSQKLSLIDDGYIGFPGQGANVSSPIKIEYDSQTYGYSSNGNENGIYATSATTLQLGSAFAADVVSSGYFVSGARVKIQNGDRVFTSRVMYIVGRVLHLEVAIDDFSLDVFGSGGDYNNRLTVYYNERTVINSDLTITGETVLSEGISFEVTKEDVDEAIGVDSSAPNADSTYYNQAGNFVRPTQVIPLSNEAYQTLEQNGLIDNTVLYVTPEIPT